MPPTSFRLDLVLIFFLYGLAFFSMGIAITLESWRVPRLLENRMLRPLAVFGLLHGAHEWMEIILLQGVWLDAAIPPQYQVIRVFWLALSFLPLLYFSIITLSAEKTRWRRLASIGGISTVLYLLLAAWIWLASPNQALLRLDVFARYFLAFPGGVMAGIALRGLADRVDLAGRQVGKLFRWAAAGFIFYGFTQLIVPPLDIFPSRYLNVQVFQQTLGFPIQILRATAAFFITFALIRAVQVVEWEREKELRDAREARLAALEQVQHELLERQEMRRELLRHIVTAQEDERARIARELHDETAQVLTALSLDLATLKDLTRQAPGASEILQRLQKLTREMSQSIYHLLHGLHPAQLDTLGLVSALQSLVDEEHRRSGLKINLKEIGARQRLDPLVETVFFRVAQEALTNVARHSQAKQASMQIIFDESEAILRICDQGVGFELNRDIRPPRGWGLAGMRERAESVGGKFYLESAPGRGTKVEVRVPTIKENIEELSHG